MVLVTYTKHNLFTNKKEMDYVSLNNLNEFINWLRELGDDVMFKLIKKNRVLTQTGWKPIEVSIPNLIQVKDSGTNMYYTIDKVVSDDGIIFEHINHCSEELVRYIALKRVEINSK